MIINRGFSPHCGPKIRITKKTTKFKAVIYRNKTLTAGSLVGRTVRKAVPGRRQLAQRPNKETNPLYEATSLNIALQETESDLDDPTLTHLHRSIEPSYQNEE